MPVCLVPVQTCAHARTEIYACAYVYAYVDWICIVHSCCVCVHESGAQQNARETFGGGPGPMASIAIASVRGHNMCINLDQERTWTNFKVLLSPPNAPCNSFYPLLGCFSLLSTSLACSLPLSLCSLPLSLAPSLPASLPHSRPPSLPPSFPPSFPPSLLPSFPPTASKAVGGPGL